MVSGPIRRASIGRLIAGLCPDIKVGTFPGGWTVSRRTGAAGTTSNFDELLDLAAPHSCVSSWDGLDAVLEGYSAAGRPEEFSDYLPRVADFHEEPELVLRKSEAAPTHLRLAAFGIGLRTLAPNDVAIEFPHRLAAFRLIAVRGIVVGSKPLHRQP